MGNIQISSLPSTPHCLRKRLKNVGCLDAPHQTLYPVKEKKEKTLDFFLGSLFLHRHRKEEPFSPTASNWQLALYQQKIEHCISLYILKSLPRSGNFARGKGRKLFPHRILYSPRRATSFPISLWPRLIVDSPCPVRRPFIGLSHNYMN